MRFGKHRSRAFLTHARPQTTPLILACYAVLLTVLHSGCSSSSTDSSVDGSLAQTKDVSNSQGMKPSELGRETSSVSAREAVGDVNPSKTLKPVYSDETAKNAAPTDACCDDDDDSLVAGPVEYVDEHPGSSETLDAIDDDPFFTGLGNSQSESADSYALKNDAFFADAESGDPGASDEAHLLSDDPFFADATSSSDRTSSATASLDQPHDNRRALETPTPRVGTDTANSNVTSSSSRKRRPTRSELLKQRRAEFLQHLLFRKHIVTIGVAQKGRDLSQVGQDFQGEPFALGQHCKGPWCSEFVSWCYAAAGRPMTGGPKSAQWLRRTAGGLKKYFISQERWVGYSPRGWGRFTPSPGDYIKYGHAGEGGGHSGIVLYQQGTTLHTVEGNVGGKVHICKRKNWRQNQGIDGFGLATPIPGR